MIKGGLIRPMETLVIPLGFGIEIPNGHTARLQVRTSIAKRGIMIQGCAIDAGYVGEISMILHNVSDEYFAWEAGDRLGYIEVYPCQYPTFVEDLEQGEVPMHLVVQVNDMTIKEEIHCLGKRGLNRQNE